MFYFMIHVGPSHTEPGLTWNINTVIALQCEDQYRCPHIKTPPCPHKHRRLTHRPWFDRSRVLGSCPAWSLTCWLHTVQSAVHWRHPSHWTGPYSTGPHSGVPDRCQTTQSCCTGRSNDCRHKDRVSREMNIWMKVFTYVVLTAHGLASVGPPRSDQMCCCKDTGDLGRDQSHWRYNRWKPPAELHKSTTPGTTSGYREVTPVIFPLFEPMSNGRRCNKNPPSPWAHLASEGAAASGFTGLNKGPGSK